MTQFIVAEVSKNWISGRPNVPGMQLLSHLFEDIINANHARGYRLHSFTLHRLAVSDDEMNETIIAVFEKRAMP